MNGRVEAFQVFITASHHAVVDVTDPQRMGNDETESEGRHDEIGARLADGDKADGGDDAGSEEGDHLDDDLHAVLEVALGGHLLLEGERLLVIDGQLEDDEMEHSGGGGHIGHQHEEGEFAGENGREHDDERHEEDGGIEPELRLQQGDDVLAVGHQQVDVVALLAHDLRQGGDAVDGKAIQTPEVLHVYIIIHWRVGYQHRETDNRYQTHDATAAHGLVADVRLQLDLQVFADDAETVEEGELRDVFQRPFSLTRDLLIDVFELEMAVDEEESYQEDKDDGQEIPAAAHLGVGVDHLSDDARLEVQQHGGVGQQIERNGWQYPIDTTVDQGAEEEVDLTVEDDQQQTGDEFRHHGPEACTCKEDDDRVGDEHGQPQEIEAAEVR